MINKISVLFLATIFSISAFAGPMIQITSEEGLNSYITKSKFNGVVLVAKDKNILMKKAFGDKNLETKVPLTTSDRFQIGSNTKQFVAASILKLQEEGLLSLQDPITKYFPELTQYKDITIRDILNHTSGISNFTDIQAFWIFAQTHKDLTLDEIISFNASYPLDFEPKTKWNYSNTGYIIAGKIVEMVSGKAWDQYVEENFLIPLKMNDSGYNKYFETVSDVSGHMLENDILKPYSEFNLSWALSAGALYSTVDDLLKWTAIYDSSSLLSENSKKDMQTPFLANYGLGINIKIGASETWINHGGHTMGFVSSLDYYKVSKLTVITLDNIDGNTPGISSVLLDFYTKGQALGIKTEPYAISPDSLKVYEGVFGAGDFELKVFVKDNQLFLQTNDGQPAYLLKPNDKDSFYIQGLSGEEFIRDEAGVIVSLKHYQGRSISDFKKKN